MKYYIDSVTINCFLLRDVLATANLDNDKVQIEGLDNERFVEEASTSTRSFGLLVDDTTMDHFRCKRPNKL